MLSLLGTIVLSLPLQAQDATPPSHRQGFWLGFGIGGGVNLSSSLDDGSKAGFASLFRAGGTLTPKWLLGGETAGWSAEVGDDAWAWRSNLSAIAIFYPSAGRGLFLKAGPGVAFISESRSTTIRVDGVDVTTSQSASEVGFGATLGVGHDIRIGRKLSLVPEVTYLLQAFEARSTSTELGDIPGTNSILLFTLGLTFH
ncbi:MAG: porin family protein [Gemmatimonadales bacterium]|nr:porin family protein [Gemmatimonadales bacterium]